MLVAQAGVFFPPMFFWICIVAIVAVIFGSITTIAVHATRADMLRRIRERELAAQLIEQMLREHQLTAGEIEQVINSFWQQGTFWKRVSDRFSPGFQRLSDAIPPAKPVAARELVTG